MDRKEQVSKAVNSFQRKGEQFSREKGEFLRNNDSVRTIIKAVVFFLLFTVIRQISQLVFLVVTLNQTVDVGKSTIYKNNDEVVRTRIIMMTS